MQRKGKKKASASTLLGLGLLHFCGLRDVEDRFGWRDLSMSS